MGSLSPISPNSLSGPLTTNGAIHLGKQLGQLAGFLLNDAAWDTVCVGTLDRPYLPQGIGCCWPVIGVQNPLWQKFLLPAFILPLQWLPGSNHDPRLPEAILECANDVRQHFSSGASENYSIHFVDSAQQWPDLSLFDRKQLEARSCFASLAAGLSSLQQQVPPDARVWASADWDNQFKPVELLEQKLTVAAKWKATSFYVASTQGEVDDLLVKYPTLKLNRLEESSGVAGPQKALSGYFVESYLEPAGEEWENCQRYHAAIRPLDRGKADAFYDKTLCRLIIKRIRCNMRISRSITRPITATHFVTIASGQIQPIQTMVTALDIRQLLVLYTRPAIDRTDDVINSPDDFSMKAAEITEQCLKRNPQLTEAIIVPFLYDSDSENFPYDFTTELSQAITTFVKDVPDQNVIFDIDRGTTLHKLALIKNVIRPNNIIATISHKMFSSKPPQIDHGTERIFLFTKDEDWAMPASYMIIESDHNCRKAIDSSVAK